MGFWSFTQNNSSVSTFLIGFQIPILQEEQEEIVKRRPSSQKGLTFTEIKQMKYLSKVRIKIYIFINRFHLHI